MRYWSRALKHPEATLHGFDSFEGLPEDWFPYRKGHFGVGGRMPEIDDARVAFFKGWFEDVLPRYTVAPHDVLVIAIDADLYSSTICVLRHLRPHITTGTFVYLDDMSQPDHEPRALAEFMAESGLRFAAVAADRTLRCVFLRCVGSGSQAASPAASPGA